MVKPCNGESTQWLSHVIVKSCNGEAMLWSQSGYSFGSAIVLTVIGSLEQVKDMVKACNGEAMQCWSHVIVKSGNGGDMQW